MDKKYYCVRCSAKIFAVDYKHPENPEYCSDCADIVTDKQILKEKLGW